ncbi:hypothetical protein BVRB_2g024340 [Beta vulgaris subsp. vulgaris]|nr:hypothetical protein BVRB_2g024340 [Beta vulgaris subsp. vulgaris]
MASFSLLLFLFITITFTFISISLQTPNIGITINHIPPSTTPEQIAAIINRHNITSVRLTNPNPNLIRAFSYSSVSLLLSIPNSFVSSLASNRSNAVVWVYTNVIPFYPRANITTISVGTDILTFPSDLSDDLLPAIRNIHLVLHQVGISKISVSSTFSLIPLITSAFPPSTAEFSEPAIDVVIKPLLDFLEESNSSFLVNLYPCDLFGLNREIVLGFALFQEGPFLFMDDYTTGVRYRNLFDTMVDAVVSAMAVAGHENIPIIVTETGWPSSPGSDLKEESYANQVFAQMYLKGLVDHLKFEGGATPLKKDGVSEVYIYELFDKEITHNSSSMMQWGILYSNLTSKYKLDFSGYSRVSGCKGFLLNLAFSLLISTLL